MSTHVLDASGQRALNLTVNDPARTAATVNAKQGDDVAVQIGGCREVRIQLPPTVKIQRRQYVSKKQVVENGRAVKNDEGEFVYEETPYEQLVLVLSGASLIAFGRTSFIEKSEGYEQTPHTTLHTKRWGGDLHFTESGELLEEYDLAELVGAEG